MVAGTVAFDAEQEATGALRIAHRKVDEEAGNTHLGDHLETLPGERLGDLDLEGAVGRPAAADMYLV